MNNNTIVISKDAINGYWGEKLQQYGILEKHTEIVLANLQYKNKGKTIYTNWFYFKDPYPYTNPFIPSHKL